MNHARAFGPAFLAVLVVASILAPIAHSPEAQAGSNLASEVDLVSRVKAESNPRLLRSLPVTPPRPFVDVAGAHETIAPAVAGCDETCEKIGAIGRWVQAKGFRVSEHPLFGGVCWCHAYGSAHYLGHAIDVNDDGGNEYARLSWLAQELASIPGIVIYWQVPGHYDHLHAEL